MAEMVLNDFFEFIGMEEICWDRKFRSWMLHWVIVLSTIQKLRLVVSQRWLVNEETWKATIGEILSRRLQSSTAARRSR